MVKIEFTNTMLTNIHRLVPGTIGTGEKAEAIRLYLKQYWAATIEYDHEHPRGRCRYLKFKDPKHAIEFVLRYG